MTDKPLLTAEALREALDYNPATGLFKWRGPLRGRAKSGEFGGCDRGGGYLTITVNCKAYRSHRLAWLHVKGKWPRFTIDHINGNPSDNRIANLRDVAIRMNVHNANRVPRREGELVGVQRRQTKGGTKWRACIGHFGRLVHIGTFETQAEAHEAYLDAKRLMHHGAILPSPYPEISKIIASG